VEVIEKMVGPGRFELPTSAMSRQRSNQLSYGPVLQRSEIY
jgi:hypothetical protein